MTASFENPSEQRALTSAAALTAVLSDAAITIPSLGVDWPTVTGHYLVTLGRVRSDVVDELTALLRDGLNARAQQQR
ncbi:hypothetical protein OG455_31810 [Kitasatospora sp. NBC_01287]|uniref:hypothetical protein n=1 Tax=Kitasatospora sp. NBC_01287 TaxID=2903573 RepID=UPI0022590A0D|nr:hypothetical protein [Kitasatospora sp. NBC_01287]MCX4750050.1 hypothetical protein [Kitasatospora sp. NBC_01287]